MDEDQEWLISELLQLPPVFVPDMLNRMVRELDVLLEPYGIDADRFLELLLESGKANGRPSAPPT